MMTRLLDLLAGAKGSPGEQLLVAVALLPLLPVAVAYDAIARTRRAALVADVERAHEAQCPGGHRVALHGGAFRCPSCGLTIGDEHSAFSCCPHCGERAAAIQCGCGLPLINPLYDAEDSNR